MSTGGRRSGRSGRSGRRSAEGGAARTGSAASYSGAMELSGANMRANVVRPASEPRLRVKPSQNRHRWQSGFPRSTSAECFCSKMPMLVSTVLATENPMPSNVVLAMLLWPAGN